MPNRSTCLRKYVNYLWLLLVSQCRILTIVFSCVIFSSASVGRPPFPVVQRSMAAMVTIISSLVRTGATFVTLFSFVRLVSLLRR
uniref:Uncharacterized protein n=1 Tax=Ixodes ricinus TaxID=34613 RepID=A0A6B0U444_IXORI